jgi:photosystem II stability/assembly factor-like uncharacterized protein
MRCDDRHGPAGHKGHDFCGRASGESEPGCRSLLEPGPCHRTEPAGDLQLRPYRQQSPRSAAPTQLSDISFADTSHGWVSGERCPGGGTSDCTGAIEGTSDGGASWVVQFQGPDPVSEVRALGAIHAVALAGRGCPQGQGPTASQGWAAGTYGGGVIIHTTDGGRTWSQQQPVPAPTTGLDLTGPSQGWGTGTAADPGAVLRSSDGGATWTVVADLPGLVQGLSALTPTQAFVAEESSPAADWSLMATSDGGRSWRRGQLRLAVHRLGRGGGHAAGHHRRGWALVAGGNGVGFLWDHRGGPGLDAGGMGVAGGPVGCQAGSGHHRAVGEHRRRRQVEALCHAGDCPTLGQPSGQLPGCLAGRGIGGWDRVARQALRDAG